MIEKPKHIKIFELYYSMGSDRSLNKLHQKYPKDTPTIDTLKNWSRAFNWQARVEQRDIENSRALEDKLKPKTNKIIVNTKADYRTEIKAQLGILKALLNKVIKDIKNESAFDIGSVNELKDIINSYEKLSKLDLLMMGEATERGELNITNAKQKLVDKINSIAKRAREGKTTK